MKLLIATQNHKKRRELEELVQSMHLPLQVVGLGDVGLADIDIIEDAPDFAGNAKIKVCTVKALLRDDDVFAIMADDSGLIVDALLGGPGVRSARFASDAGAGEGDDANNELLLQRLRGAENRSARFACAIALLVHDRPLITAYGEVFGDIATEPRGEGGFGYDPLFVPRRYPHRRMAELSPTEKHQISHRGKAMRDALNQLRASLPSSA